MAKSFSAKIAQGQEKLAKSGYDIKLLDDKNLLLPFDMIIDNFNKKFGKVWDAAEQRIIGEAFGSEEAAAVFMLMKDKNAEFCAKQKFIKLKVVII
ncbi:MAG: hypothetical protein HRU28_15710 [Rhizobiales bacterium]|nr:hypothetical protein [Hyphomicrobiales bacterium]